MTPIFMVKDGASRYDGRNDGLREYLRTEYGSPDTGWLIADAEPQDGKPPKMKLAARLRSWIGRKVRGGSPLRMEVRLEGN